MPPAAASRAVAAAPNSDRRQSTRQGRTSVTRPTNYYARPFAGRLAAMGGLEQTPPASNASPGFLPALTHFTNAVDAFPKEMINHFSMFKEVEAKIHDPEHVLQILLDEIAKQPVPMQVERQKAAQATRDASINGSVNGSIPDGQSRHQQLSEDLFPADFADRPSEEQAQLRKRQLFFRMRLVIASMLPTLDEKLVVLTSATATKDKCLARLNSSYAHIDDEISEEARYGSLNHWAYADKEEKKKGGTSNERQRREVASANNLAAAAQQVHDADSIAAKSEARREAMLAKRHKNQHVDSDFDDSRPVKKTQKRKAAAENAAHGAIGLGISNGTAQQGKRKKTEKALAAAVAAPAMERSLSGALQSAAAGGRNGGSPRSTPAAENGPKRKPRAPGPGPGRKRAPNAIGTQSPLLVSSPLATNFPASIAAAAQRPQSSRARKNSTTNSVVSAAQEPSAVRPSSSQSTRPINSSAIAELEQAAAGVVRENLSAKDGSTPKEPAENILPPFASSGLKHEEPEPTEPEAMEVDGPSPAPVTTRAGRASKTATPIVGTFPPDIPMVRSRSTRNVNNGNGGTTSQTSSENNSTTTAPAKRTHKKSISTHTATILPSPAAATKPIAPTPNKSAPSSTTSTPPPDPELSDAVDEDGDEPRYCYCNEVSYGNMIACDNTECPREWFHLACVNMEKAPSARTKWFCSDECRERFQAVNKNKGGRPSTATGEGKGSGTGSRQ